MKIIKRILLGIVIVALLALLTILLIPGSAWDGAKIIRARVQVEPQVKNVKIWLIPYHHLDLSVETKNVMHPPVMTDENGKAELSTVCRAGGGKGYFFKTGRLDIDSEIVIEAHGYRKITSPLANFIRGNEWSFRKEHFDFKVWLIKVQQAQTPPL